MIDRPEAELPGVRKLEPHQKMEQDALDAVANAVQATREATGEAPTADERPVVEDFGNLSAEPLLKFCEAAAVQIEQAGTEIAQEGARLEADCQRLAEEIRHVAEAQAKAIRRNTARTRTAAVAVTQIRDAFRDDLAKELAEVKAIEDEVKRAVRAS
jgi:hypothetical protein